MSLGILSVNIIEKYFLHGYGFFFHSLNGVFERESVSF